MFNHYWSTYLLNSTKMQVILSVPMPSDAAKFVGHILSNINSIVLDNPKPYKSFDPVLLPGELLPAFVRDFFPGEFKLFLPEEFADVDPFIFLGEVSSPFIVYILLLSFDLVS